MGSRGGSRGFSLVEVGMGILVMAFLFLPTLVTLQTGAEGTTHLNRLTRAFQAGRMVVDAAESFTYDELTDAALAGVVSALPVADGVERPRVDPLEIVRQGLPGGGGWLEAKVVTVRVSWRRTDGPGGTQDVMLRTVVVKTR